MRRGEPIAPSEFLKLLHEDEAFCAQLGRAVLAASLLETQLGEYLRARDVSVEHKKATLGHLLTMARKHDLLKDMHGVLEMLRDQRNYLAHSLPPLFLGLIPETLLTRDGLLDSDVDTFTEKAREFTENVSAIADLVVQRQSEGYRGPR